MKTLGVILFVGLAITTQAQYKAPSQYFRKDFPAPKPNSAQPAQQPQQHHALGNPQPSQAPQAVQAPSQPPQTAHQKFKEVGTNSQFFFLTDTNHAYPWTKVTATTATNTKTGARQSFHPEMPVQR